MYTMQEIISRFCESTKVHSTSNDPNWCGVEGNGFLIEMDDYAYAVIDVQPDLLHIELYDDTCEDDGNPLACYRLAVVERSFKEV